MPETKVKQQNLMKGEPYESQTDTNPRSVKSAPRNNSESAKSRNKNKMISNGISQTDNGKRSSSFKERKQKPSPLRTQKIPPSKPVVGIQNYMPANKSKSNTSNI